MTHKIKQYYLSLVLIMGSTCTAFAGQISVINPSAGTEVTGVVTITPNAPAATTSGPSPQGQASNLSANFETGGHLSPRVAQISDKLMQIDLGSFSVNEQEELIELITDLMSSGRLSAGQRAVLSDQVERFRALR